MGEIDHDQMRMCVVWATLTGAARMRSVEEATCAFGHVVEQLLQLEASRIGTLSRTGTFAVARSDSLVVAEKTTF